MIAKGSCCVVMQCCCDHVSVHVSTNVNLIVYSSFWQLLGLEVRPHAWSVRVIPVQPMHQVVPAFWSECSFMRISTSKRNAISVYATSMCMDSIENMQIHSSMEGIALRVRAVYADPTGHENSSSRDLSL